MVAAGREKLLILSCILPNPHPHHRICGVAKVKFVIFHHLPKAPLHIHDKCIPHLKMNVRFL